jgi:hypothetical protein
MVISLYTKKAQAICSGFLVLTYGIFICCPALNFAATEMPFNEAIAAGSTSPNLHAIL